MVELLEAKTGVKKEHILSSNLGSLAAVVEILHQCESPAAVFKVRYCLNLTCLEIYSCCSVAFQPREWPHKSN
jgi:hypothetical protein